MARLMLALFYTAWADLHIFSSGYAKTSSVDHVDCPRFLCPAVSQTFKYNGRMKKMVLFAVALSGLSPVFAQDFIRTTQGESIKARVIEVGTDAIRYYKWESSQQVVYSINRNLVQSIDFEDGTVEQIATAGEKPREQVPEQVPDRIQPQVDPGRPVTSAAESDKKDFKVPKNAYRLRGSYGFGWNTKGQVAKVFASAFEESGFSSSEASSIANDLIKSKSGEA